MAKVPLAVGKDFETRLLRLFRRLGRHLLIGEISLDTGYRLDAVEYNLEDLVYREAVRHVTEEERKALGLHELTVAYVLVSPEKFTIVT